MSLFSKVDIPYSPYSTLEYQRYSFERTKLELSVHRIRLNPSSVCDKCLYSLSSGILGQLVLDLRCCEIENHQDYFPLIFLDVCVYTLVLGSEVREQSVYLSSSAVDSVTDKQATYTSEVRFSEGKHVLPKAQNTVFVSLLLRDIPFWVVVVGAHPWCAL